MTDEAGNDPGCAWKRHPLTKKDRHVWSHEWFISAAHVALMSRVLSWDPSGTKARRKWPSSLHGSSGALGREGGSRCIIGLPCNNEETASIRMSPGSGNPRCSAHLKACFRCFGSTGLCPRSACGCFPPPVGKACRSNSGRKTAERALLRSRPLTSSTSTCSIHQE